MTTATAATKKRVEVLHKFTVVNDEASVKKYYKEFCRLLREGGEEGQIKIRRLSRATLLYLVRK